MWPVHKRSHNWWFLQVKVSLPAIGLLRFRKRIIKERVSFILILQAKLQRSPQWGGKIFPITQSLLYPFRHLNRSSVLLRPQWFTRSSVYSLWKSHNIIKILCHKRHISSDAINMNNKHHLLCLCKVTACTIQVGTNSFPCVWKWGAIMNKNILQISEKISPLWPKWF